jgi:hypothetical protein
VALSIPIAPHSPLYRSLSGASRGLSLSALAEPPFSLVSDALHLRRGHGDQQEETESESEARACPRPRRRPSPRPRPPLVEMNWLIVFSFFFWVAMSDKKVAAMTFYRRLLPDTCISFSSPEGRRRLIDGLQSGTCNIYPRLAEHYCTQSHPAFCGLSSLTMALNALEIDPCRIWQGPWRWYAEDFLDCCEPLSVIEQKGITIGKLQCLAKCNGADAKIYWPTEQSIEAFRKLVQDVCKDESQNGRVLVLSYDRGSLGQSGTGHFSPCGGYHQESDSVLILDVARFKYPPHWVPLNLIYEAMLRIDPETGRSRGALLLQKDSFSPPCYFTATFDKHERWPAMADWMRGNLYGASTVLTSSSWEEFTASAMASVMPLLDTFGARNDDGINHGSTQHFLRGLELHPIYKHIWNFVQENGLEEGCDESIKSDDCCPPPSSKKSHIAAAFLLAFLELASLREDGGTTNSSQKMVTLHSMMISRGNAVPEIVKQEISNLANMLHGFIKMY